MRSKSINTEFLVLLLISPVAYLYINISRTEPVTELDKINSYVLWSIFLGWLVFAPSLPNESVVLLHLIVFSLLTFIWLLFWLLPWLQFALSSLIALVSLISMFTAESYVGQFLVFLAASIWAFISLGVTVAADSLNARYWRMNWLNPSPLEEKTGLAMSPYNRPRTITDTDSPLDERSGPSSAPISRFSSHSIRNSALETDHSVGAHTLQIEPDNPLREMPAMEQYKVERRLNSIGKQVFVEQYNLFCDYACQKIMKNNAIEQLMSNNVSDENGAKIRLNNAKKLFDNKEERAALILVILAKKVDYSTIQRAKEILESLGQKTVFK